MKVAAWWRCMMSTRPLGSRSCRHVARPSACAWRQTQGVCGSSRTMCARALVVTHALSKQARGDSLHTHTSVHTPSRRAQGLHCYGGRAAAEQAASKHSQRAVQRDSP